MSQHGHSHSTGRLAVAFGMLIAVLVVSPLAALSLGTPQEAWTTASWRAVLLDPDVHATALRSVAVALLAAGLAGLIAMPFALAATTTAYRRRMLAILALLALAVPPFLLAAVVRSAFDTATIMPAPLADQRHLVLLIATYALHFTPIMLMGLIAGLDRLDRELPECARCHGVSDLTTWRRITLPIVTPPFVLASTVVLLRTLGDVGAPLTLGVDGLLAGTVLTQVDDGVLSTYGLQSALMLVATNAVLVAVAWRHLLAPATLKVDQRDDGRGTGAVAFALLGLLGLLILGPPAWMALRVDWPMLPGEGLAQLQGLGPALFPVVVATMVATITIGLPATLLDLTDTWPARLVRALIVLLLLFPGFVLALGFQAMAKAWPFAELLPAGWPVLAAALATTLPIIPVLPHIGAQLAYRPDAELAEAAYCTGGHPSWLRFRLKFPNALRLAVALGVFGAALGLLDIAPTAALHFIDSPMLPTQVLWQAKEATTDDIWATTGLSLVITNASLLAIGGLLLRGRRRQTTTSPRNRMGRPA